MRSVVVDKIASVAVANDIGREVRISPTIPCEEGVLIAVEVLNNKSRYNALELTSGRMAQVKRGDVIVGALGHRKALFGYSGHLPEQLAPEDTVQILNLGGVLGICDSINPTHGQPFDCRVLGVVLEFPYLGERIGVPARVGTQPLDLSAPADVKGVLNRPRGVPFSWMKLPRSLLIFRSSCFESCRNANLSALEEWSLLVWMSELLPPPR